MLAISAYISIQSKNYKAIKPAKGLIDNLFQKIT
jgi:hypothetical protein